MSTTQLERMYDMFRERFAAMERPPESILDFRAFHGSQAHPPAADDVVVESVILGGIAADVLRVGAAVTGGGVVMWFHGGGFCTGSPAGHHRFAGELSRACSRAVVVPDYRLAPEHPFPAALTDCVAVYRAILGAGTPAHRIVLAGDSAGGGLALSTIHAARLEGLPLPAGVFCVSPMLDPTMSGSSWRTNAERDLLNSWNVSRSAYDLYIGDHDRADPLVRPGCGDLRGFPPLLIQAGSVELLLDDSIDFAQRAARADVAVTLEIGAGMPHIWTLFADVLDDGASALASAGRWIERVSAP